MQEKIFNDPVQEKKAQRNGVELPIECILLQPTESKPFQRRRPPHYHDYIEFLFGLDECEVKAWLAGEELTFTEGELLVINANVAHDCFSLLPRSHYICVKILPQMIYFSENPMYDVKYVVPFLQHNLVPYQFFDRNALRESGLADIFTKMMDCWTRQEYGYEIALKSLFLEVFLWIIRYNHQHTRALMEPTADISYENIRLIQRSIEYINQNYADITETDAAAHVNLSYSYYSKLFRRVVGKNFNDYLTTVRINEAEHLLLSTDQSVTEIALSAGFASSSHFIEKFRKIKKVTPKQYRMNLQS
ncbi:MAG: helix-turn-helix transcriptional regulator [Clostridia bacterium]|nr:helix-turn-helix transcriptional regulator [Clostridia bacterium]